MIRSFLLLLTLFAFCTSAFAQRVTEVVRPSMHYVSALEMPATRQSSSTLIRYIRPDHQRYYRLSTPLFMQRYASGAQFLSGGYWTGYITTQSFRSGKVGTFYYWDVQGNLRESRLFFDINRKNKYSFKLVVPRL
jgi:hypothetical protein